MSNLKKLLAFHQFIRIIKTLSGRDKFNKSIQYTAKTLSHFSKDASITQTLKKLDSGISTSRKVDRLFWSLIDLYDVHLLINDSQLSSNIKLLSIISSICSAMSFFCENKIFLSKIGVLTNVDESLMDVLGGKFDVLGIGISLFLLFLIILKNENENEYNEKNDNNKNKINKIKFIGMLCDWLQAFNDSGYLYILFNKVMNDGEYGVLGLVSSLATLYRAHLQLN